MALEDTLRGNKKISEYATLDSGSTVERRCVNCFYRTGERAGWDLLDYITAPMMNLNCEILPADGMTPHIMFNVSPKEHLPEMIDGKEVGNYCPYWIPYDAD